MASFAHKYVVGVACLLVVVGSCIAIWCYNTFISGKPPPSGAKTITIYNLHLDRAHFFMKEKQYAQAEKMYDRALKSDPKMVPALMGRAQARFATHQYEQCIKDLETAEMITRSVVDSRFYYIRGASQYRARHFDDALDSLTKCIRANTEYIPAAHLERARVYFELSMYYEAIRDASRFINADKEFAPAYELRAMAYLGLGQVQDALNDVDKYRELNGEDAVYVKLMQHIKDAD